MPRTDCSNAKTKITKATTTPLVASFFKSFFNQNTPARKCERVRLKSKKRIGDENAKPMKRSSSINTTDEEYSDVEEMSPHLAVTHSAKKRKPRRRSHWKRHSVSNATNEKSSDDESSSQENKLKSRQKKGETTHPNEDLDKILSLSKMIKEQYRLKSELIDKFVTDKLKENVARSEGVTKDQIKEHYSSIVRKLTAELKNLENCSIEELISCPKGSLEKQNKGCSESEVDDRCSSRELSFSSTPVQLRRKSKRKSTAAIDTEDLTLTDALRTPKEQLEGHRRSKKSKLNVDITTCDSDRPLKDENIDPVREPSVEHREPSVEHQRPTQKSRRSKTTDFNPASKIERNDTQKSLRNSNENRLERDHRPIRLLNLNVKLVDCNRNSMIDKSLEPVSISPSREHRRSVRKSVTWRDLESSTEIGRSEEDDRSEKEQPSRKPEKSVEKKVAKSSKGRVDSDSTPKKVAKKSLDMKIKLDSENTLQGRRKRGRKSRQSVSLPDEMASDDGSDDAECLPKKKSKYSETESTVANSRLSHLKATTVHDVRVDDFVSVHHKREIGRITKIQPGDNRRTKCHVHWFIRSIDTVLGDVGHEREIFEIDECEDVDRTEVVGVFDVTRFSPKARYDEGNSEFGEWSERAKQKTNALFYQKRYEPKFGRFQDLLDHDSHECDSCFNCVQKKNKEAWESISPVGQITQDEPTGQFIVEAVLWRGEEYKSGMCCFLTPGTLELPQRITSYNAPADETYDESEFPEKYRKLYSREEDIEVSEPFDVGYICEIFSKNEDFASAENIYLRVKKYYRPYNTHLTTIEADRQDLNLLYWSDEESVVNFKTVQGKCFVAFERYLCTSVTDWSAKGPYRFYFCEKYDSMESRFDPITEQDVVGFSTEETLVEWPSVDRPLSMMDVFSGCGGLTEGLQQSGVAECRWAIDNDEVAARAFQLNNKHTIVYVKDCVDQLKAFKKGGVSQSFPRRGDVELLCGGPPCTGLSRMDRSKDGDYSSFDDSLIGSFLSYCDYFRPRFVLLENVRDFISACQGTVFRLSLSRLIKLGYQVTFGVLQCGKFGIPQSRRRAIILAAAPGEILPNLPEPTHAFLNKFLDMHVNGKKVTMDQLWSTGPYRAITVADALSDLPRIENDDEFEEMLYRNEPFTHFQQMMRESNSRGDDVLKDHVCKKMTLLNWLRICHIPPMGDWRDLPNKEIELSDGTHIDKLQYTHRDWKNGDASNGDFRGVCACASRKGARCSQGGKQTETLIPWCLPHTANRHAQWSGLFGRVGWNSHFRTVVTNPAPMGKQGRVLHPVQDRVFSVRECARSQGFPDSFHFYGNINEKYQQIGNAFTPPLAKAIGDEIKKCISGRSLSQL